jgi:hypothetical protein
MKRPENTEDLDPAFHEQNELHNDQSKKDLLRELPTLKQTTLVDCGLFIPLFHFFVSYHNSNT